MKKTQQYEPRELMELAIEVMRQSVPEPRDDGKASPKVGAVLMEANRELIVWMEAKIQAKLAEVWGEEANS